MFPSSRRCRVLYVHQQVFQALIKIYSLVDCPIYSVVKYRPREFALTDPPRQILYWIASNPMFGAKRLSLNRKYGCRVTPNVKLDFGGADRDRTGGLLVANQALSQLSYSPTDLVGLGRVELPTSPLSGVRSSHLSYRPGFPNARAQQSNPAPGTYC